MLKAVEAERARAETDADHTGDERRNLRSLVLRRADWLELLSRLDRRFELSEGVVLQPGEAGYDAYVAAEVRRMINQRGEIEKTLGQLDAEIRRIRRQVGEFDGSLKQVGDVGRPAIIQLLDPQGDPGDRPTVEDGER